jgi:hypothetical protein
LATPLIAPRCHQISNPQCKLKGWGLPIFIIWQQLVMQWLTHGVSQIELLGILPAKIVRLLMRLPQVSLAARFGCLRRVLAHLVVPTATQVVALLGLVMVLVDKLWEVPRRLSGIKGGL